MRGARLRRVRRLSQDETRCAVEQDEAGSGEHREGKADSDVAIMARMKSSMKEAITVRMEEACRVKINVSSAHREPACINWSRCASPSPSLGSRLTCPCCHAWYFTGMYTISCGISQSFCPCNTNLSSAGVLNPFSSLSERHSYGRQSL